MKAPAREVLRIAASMTVACAIGAAVLGAVYAGTARYQERTRIAGERRAVTEMLALGPDAEVRQVHQYLGADRRSVIYDVAGSEGTAARELVFDLDGRLLRSGVVPAEEPERGRMRLGRMFVATSGGRPAGFVVEGETRGYKNVIRFFVALDASFEIAGVRVIEHEEDPGLGAETATPWFQGQFVGRSADSLATLDVTRDPMPEDWRAALEQLDRASLREWRTAQRALIARERSRPIYAVTGATISSRAVTDGVRATVDHFRRRWALIGPHLQAGGTSS